MAAKNLLLCVAMVGVGFLGSEMLHAQSGIKRTLLQRSEVPGSNYEAVLGIAEIPPGGTAGRHTHPGFELGYLMEGELVLLVDGAGERHFKAGDSWRLEDGKPHDVRVIGDKPARVMAVYVVEKGKPIATPAP
jgi:quercetin dioxygenase-like cupin family protein